LFKIKLGFHSTILKFNPLQLNTMASPKPIFGFQFMANHLPRNLKVTAGAFKSVLFFLMLIGFSTFFGQQDINIRVDGKYSKLSAFDTNYIYKYNSKFLIGPCLSYRNYVIVLHPDKVSDSSFVPNLKWRSPSNRFWGIDFNYDKFGFTASFSNFAPKKDREKKGESASSSFGITYGGNRFFVDFSTRSFRGFYEKSIFSDTTSNAYYQSPSLTSLMLNIKFYYFTNHHKFAFKSAYGGLYRQLKSQMSWVFSSNLHGNIIVTDSTIVPNPDRKNFNNALQVSGMACVGISVFAGIAANIIIKKGYFINLAYLAGPDFQALSTITSSTATPIQRNYVNYAHDIRFATGFNFEQWYFTFTLSHDLNRFNTDLLSLSGRLNSYSVNLGFRFGVKQPRFYTKFQKTWLYNAF